MIDGQTFLTATHPIIFSPSWSSFDRSIDRLSKAFYIQTYTMATPEAQAKAQALNAKLEGEARIVIDQIDKEFVRKKAREAHACALSCYDKAGKTGSSDALEACVRNCQVPHQQATNYVQQVGFGFGAGTKWDFYFFV
jgi:hypothetical protein